MKSCFNFPSLAKNRIEIWNYTSSISNTGGETIAWALASSVWAVIKPASGREVFQYGTLESRVTHVFTIRYQQGLKNTADTAKRMIKFDGREFSINYIKNMDEALEYEGRDYQVLLCEENASEFVNG